MKNPKITQQMLSRAVSNTSPKVTRVSCFNKIVSKCISPSTICYLTNTAVFIEKIKLEQNKLNFILISHHQSITRNKSSYKY
jgi:hypothetical protein